MTSDLVLRSARPVAVKHPRLAASAWFSACGAVSVVTWFAVGQIIGTIVHGGVAPAFEFTYAAIAAVVAGLGAILPGALFGAGIFDRRRVNSVRQAVVRGLLVTLASHLTSGIGVAAVLAPSSVGFVSLLATFFGLVLFGWTSVPIGCLGAWALWKWSSGKRGPAGCRIHGYRDTEVQAA